MYRIVEIERADGSYLREVAAYESAYTALAELRSAVLGGALSLQLLAPNGVVLVDGPDVLDE